MSPGEVEGEEMEEEVEEEVAPARTAQQQLTWGQFSCETRSQSAKSCRTGEQQPANQVVRPHGRRTHQQTHQRDRRAASAQGGRPRTAQRPGVQDYNAPEDTSMLAVAPTLTSMSSV